MTTFPAPSWGGSLRAVRIRVGALLCARGPPPPRPAGPGARVQMPEYLRAFKWGEIRGAAFKCPKRGAPPREKRPRMQSSHRETPVTPSETASMSAPNAATAAARAPVDSAELANLQVSPKNGSKTIPFRNPIQMRFGGKHRDMAFRAPKRST